MTTILRLPAEPAELTLPALLLRNAEDHGDRPALSWRAGADAAWTTLTWREVRRETAALAAGYAALGVERGEHVLMMMGNRPEHWLSDLALTHLGAVPVTVCGTASPERVSHIARYSRARLAIVEGARERRLWEPPVADPGTRLDRLVVAEAEQAGPHRTYDSLKGRPTLGPFPNLGVLEKNGGVLEQRSLLRAGAREGTDLFEKAWRESRSTDPLTVVHPSGSTGEPRGVRLTHRNVLMNARALDRLAALPDPGEHIGHLPLAHIAGRMLGLYLPVFRAAHVYLCADPAEVGALARELRPAQFFGVPRVWEKLATAVRAALAGLPASRRAAVDEAMETARAHVRCRERGAEPPADLEEAYRTAKERMLDPVLAHAGLDRLVWAASASAPTPPDVTDFWAAFGLVIMDVWGPAETTGAATANTPGAFRPGSVGRPLDGLEVRTAEDGEILVRGASVFDGYLRADGTVEDVRDAEGWFATGELGRVDEDGFLRLTGRGNELIAPSAGRNV